MEFTLPQFKQWLEETFPDNRARAIEENNFRDGLAAMADFVFQTNSSEFIQQKISEIAAMTTEVDDNLSESLLLKQQNEALVLLAQSAKETTEILRNQTQSIKESADLNYTGARIFQDSVNFATNVPNLASLTLNNTTDKGKFWKVGPLGSGNTNITGTAVAAKEGDEFTWNGTKWVWTNSGISNYSVTPEKTSFVQKKTSRNLVNTNDPLVGLGKTFNLSNGALIDNASYNATGFIGVVPEGKYVVSIKRTIVWFDLNKNFISADQSNTNTANYILTAPAGAYYMKSTAPIATWGVSFQIEKGEVATAFVPYSESQVIEGILIDQATARLKEEIRTFIIGLLVVATNQIQNKAVTKEKAAFIKELTSKNLVNPGDVNVLLGQTLAPENGRPFVNASNNTTGFMPVIGNEHYVISHKRAVCFYTSASVNAWLSTDNDNVGNTNVVVAAPATATYMRCSMRAENWPAFQVEKGTAATPYEPYNPEIIYELDGVRVNSLGTGAKNDVKEVVNNESVELLGSFGIGVNRLTIAPKLFIPLGHEIAVYLESLQKCPSVAGCEIVIPNAKETDRSSRLIPSELGTIAGVARLGNAKKVATSEKNFSIKVTDPTLTTPKKIILVGSSTTWRSTFINRLMASPAAAGLDFIGLRQSSNSVPTILCEGRGGWTLSSYSLLNKNLYSPFVQPGGVYMYLGNTDFWIKANAGLSDAVNLGYDYNKFVVRTQFNASTGYPLVPVLNTVVYDNTLSKFFRYSGSAWVEISEATLAFSFNFGKYRQTWGIAQPDIFHLLIGSNDFNSANELTFGATYAVFKTRMDNLIASVKADSPNCKILLGITYSSGKQGENGTFTTERRKLGLWLFAEKMIADYGNRENENIILVDYHSTIDRTYGFAAVDEKPFADYAGSFRERYVADTTHLGADGFMQMGDLFFGAIQDLR